MENNCAFCNHSEKDHCKGGVSHTNYKEDARMLAVADRRHTVTCVSRHCKVALCCCIGYLGPLPAMYQQAESAEEREQFAERLARDRAPGPGAAKAGALAGGAEDF